MHSDAYGLARKWLDEEDFQFFFLEHYMQILKDEAIGTMGGEYPYEELERDFWMDEDWVLAS